MSATIRDGYKFELGTRLGVHGVGAVGSAFVIVFLGRWCAAISVGMFVRDHGISISKYLFPMSIFRKIMKLSPA